LLEKSLQFSPALQAKSEKFILTAGPLMITGSGRHIQITEKRHCSKCSSFTEQVCHKVRYQENPEQSEALIKKSYWVCPICLTESDEVKNQILPGDKVRIINRLLRMQEDYAIQSMNISSQAEKLVIEITIRD
jgi:hypothetical protein